MIFNTTKDSLVNAMGVISRGIASRSAIPVIQGVLVEAKDGKLIFTSNNLQMSIRGVVDDVEVWEDGSLVLPERFVEALKKLPEQQVGFRVAEKDGGTNVELTSGKSKYTFYPMDSEEFPAFRTNEEIAGWECITFKTKDIKDMVDMVAFAVSKDEGKPTFTGVQLIADEGGNMQCIASDTYRVARMNMVIDNTNPFNVLIPGKNLIELSKVLEGGDAEVRLYMSHREAVFEYGNYMFASRLLDGNYPDVDRVYPINSPTKVTVDIKALEDTLSRASVMAFGGNPKGVFSVSGGRLDIKVQEDTGAYDESVEVNKEGDDVQGAIFNIRYLTDPLKVIPGQSVEIEFNGDLGPCVFRWRNDEEGLDYSYLTLPIKTTRA